MHTKTRRTSTTLDGFAFGTLELLGGHTGRPLLICLPGGSYTADYFDVPGVSMLHAAADVGYDIVAVDRPNYGSSDRLATAETTFARNADILVDAIACLWQRLGGRHPGVVLVGHSIGGAIATHIAARRDPGWPLLGISISGVNELSPEHVVDAFRAIPAAVAELEFSPDQRLRFMYGPDGSHDADILERAAVGAAAIPMAELREITGGWLVDLRELAPRVGVPVQYAIGEHDGLWLVTQQRVDNFAGRFANAGFVDASLVAGAGHNIDHHKQGPEWHRRQFDFADRCAERAGELRRATEMTL